MLMSKCISVQTFAFFIAGVLLFFLSTLMLSCVRSETSSLSADPGTYLQAGERSTIQTVVGTAAHPNIYLNAVEIEDIRARVDAGEEPWQSAYEQMMAAANEALGHEPYSITSNGGPEEGHAYETQRPYCGWTAVDGEKPDCRDGQINPQADRQDYEGAIALGKDVSTLGLAYALTQESQYAEKILSFIRTWCLDPQTRMTPKYTNQSSKIELSITIPGLFYGADLAYNYAAWPEQEKAGFENWVREMTESALGWDRKNNFENWRVNFIAAAGALLKEESFLNYAFGRYKELIPLQINRRGQLVEELDRTTSLSYALYALNAMTQTAEVARHQGLNLYDYVSDQDIGLKLVADYHAEFAASRDAEGWPKEQISPLKANDNVAIYEMLHHRWPEPPYMKVID